MKIPKQEPRSKNMYDVHKWVINVIDSCTTTEQYLRAHKLVSLFEKMYNDYDMVMVLRYTLENKFSKLTYEKLERNDAKL